MPTMAGNLTLTYGYTAKDLAAVHAYLQRVAPAIIARTCYDGDEDSFASTPSAMEWRLRTMLDGLTKVAIEQGSPALAEYLRSSIKKHGEPKLTAVTFRMVTEASAPPAASPAASHSIGRWFRPRVASRLKRKAIETLGELIAFCNRQGGSWWRTGAGRAAVVVAWLRQHETHLRLCVDVKVDTRDPLAAAEVVQVRVLSDVRRLSGDTYTGICQCRGSDQNFVQRRGVNRWLAHRRRTTRRDLVNPEPARSATGDIADAPDRGCQTAADAPAGGAEFP
jgi:hypothetical protein